MIIAGHKCSAWESPGDGSCLFHSVCKCVYRDYEKHPTEFVRRLRCELADMLPRRYEELYNGNLPAFSVSFPEYKCENMQRVLRDAREWVGYGYLEFICDMLCVDLFVVEEATGALYASDETVHCVKGRETVVLLYGNGHYRPILHEGQGLFAAGHAIPKFLRRSAGLPGC